jgi:mRNA interferase HigB
MMTTAVIRNGHRLRGDHIDPSLAGYSQFGIVIEWPVRSIAKRALRNFWKRYPKSKSSLEAWHQEVAHADWGSPSAVKAHFRSASVLQGNRDVFIVAGNQYWLIVKINYPYRVEYIRFIGTHSEYDAIDVMTV